MVIALTGFMGSGKSSVGRETAALLCFPFMDLDEEIEAREGRSVRSILENDGEEAFRERELEVLGEVLDAGRENLVLALGGGTFINGKAREMILRRTFCVWLDASFDEILRRVPDRSSRPLFSQKLYIERLPVYSLAHARVCTEGGSPREIARRIMNLAL